MLRQWFSIGTLLALALPVFADFTPTKSPVSPDGTRAACDIPTSQHMRNTGGSDGPRGPGSGSGLCVFTSCEISSRWQNDLLAGFQKWMTYKPGGGSPRKLQAMLTQFCREKGIQEPDYVQHTGGDMAFLDTAIKTRRMPCITYAGSDDFYRGGIDHMVCLAHLDQTHAAIIDNNRPGVWVWMTRSELEVRWKARGGGWAVVFLRSPPPPQPELREYHLFQAIKVPFSAKRIVWSCSATRTEVEEAFRSYGVDWNGSGSPRKLQAVPAQQFRSSSCPGGRCSPTVIYPGSYYAPQYYSPCPGGTCPSPSPPSPSYAPVPYTPDSVADASPVKGSEWSDQMASSVRITRTISSVMSEGGTGTVIGEKNGESFILTNAHVVEDGEKPIEVRTTDGKVYAAKYVGGSPVTHTGPNSIRVDGPDLALISVNAKLPVVQVATQLPPTGTPVCQWGYGKVTSDGNPFFKTGKTLSQENYVGAIQRTSIPSQQGDSGSGIFNEKGSLVAVGWGGGNGVQFCVRLDAVLDFLGKYLKSGDNIKTEEKGEGESRPENHGILRDELDFHTKDGKRTYWINGREVGRPQALDAVSAGGLGLVDDSDRYHLSLVTADAAVAKSVLSDPKLATLLGKVHVQIYSPSDWVPQERLKAKVTLQEPSPKGGKVIWTAEVIDVSTLAEGLKRTDPNWKPEPPTPPMPIPTPPTIPDSQPKPKPDAPPETPNTPTPPSAPQTPASLPTPLLILLALAALYYFLPKKVN